MPYLHSVIAIAFCILFIPVSIKYSTSETNIVSEAGRADHLPTRDASDSDCVHPGASHATHRALVDGLPPSCTGAQTRYDGYQSIYYELAHGPRALVSELVWWYVRSALSAGLGFSTVSACSVLRKSWNRSLHRTSVLYQAACADRTSSELGLTAQPTPPPPSLTQGFMHLKKLRSS